MSETKSTHPCFIHSALDDRDLSAPQFRVFCHIARRGVCYAAGATIAQVCRLSRDTVFECITYLVGQRMISREHRFGKTTELQVLPVEQWHPSETKGRVQGAYPSETKGHGRRKVRDGYPSETKGHKGNPLKGDPIKEKTFSKSKSAAPICGIRKGWME